MGWGDFVNFVKNIGKNTIANHGHPGVDLATVGIIPPDLNPAFKDNSQTSIKLTNGAAGIAKLAGVSNPSLDKNLKAYNDVNAQVQKYHTGGRVKRDGKAILLKNEYVLPRGVKPTKVQIRKVEENVYQLKEKKRIKM